MLAQDLPEKNLKLSKLRMFQGFRPRDSFRRGREDAIHRT